MGAEPPSRQLVGPDPLPHHHHHHGHTRPAARSSQLARTFPRRRDPQPLTFAPHRPCLTVASASVLCTLAGRCRTACRRWPQLRRCGAAATKTPSLTNAEPSDALGGALCNHYQTDRGWTWRAEPRSRRCARRVGWARGLNGRFPSWSRLLTRVAPLPSHRCLSTPARSVRLNLRPSGTGVHQAASGP